MNRIRAALPFLALAFAACSGAPEPAQTSAPTSAVAVIEATQVNEAPTPAIIGPCPVQWTCDEVRWYTTRATCQTSCGPSCFLEEHDNGHCIPR
jgi:hypothetical protein